MRLRPRLRQALVYRFTKRLAGLELQDLPRRDQHAVAVFWIAAQARRMLGHCKAAEPADFDATARAQGAIEGPQNRLDGQFRIREGQLPEATGQCVDEVGSVHLIRFDWARLDWAVASLRAYPVTRIL